ncbi:hypothetical protein KIW84_035126 [Lathyrus oleraceus]|uniref:PB1-like domain-containing protein n=1 Tax=Pisum sativum TaxID=3888 RepID=A0A9D4Y1Z5_PEA|nr:hypothetical protein KIW84_035126 [Pisum sativum]
MKTTSANTKKRSSSVKTSSVKTSSVKCPKSEDSQHFSVTLHHGGEFYRVFEEEIIYRGGTDTTVNGIHVSNWNMDNIEKLLSRLGYKADCVRAIRSNNLDHRRTKMQKSAQVVTTNAYEGLWFR